MRNLIRVDVPELLTCCGSAELDQGYDNCSSSMACNCVITADQFSALSNSTLLEQKRSEGGLQAARVGEVVGGKGLDRVGPLRAAGLNKCSRFCPARHTI